MEDSKIISILTEIRTMSDSELEMIAAMANSMLRRRAWKAIKALFPGTTIDKDALRIARSVQADLAAEAKEQLVKLKLAALQQSGYTEIKDRDLWDLLNIEEREKLSYAKQLKALGVTKRQKKDGWYYIIPYRETKEANE